MEDHTGRCCTECGETKPLTEFYAELRRKDRLRPDCKACGRASVKAWRQANVAHALATRRRGVLRRRYGITPQEYADMLAAQGGVCVICGQNPQPDIALPVDHNHATGRVRGLLCRPCNSGIALLGEDLDRMAAAMEYLRSRG